MDFERLQLEQREWAAHNFPGNTVDIAFKGVVEEVGELSHAMLKQEQCIRGTWAEHEEKMMDAWGDIIVYLIEFATQKKWDADAIITFVWDEVRQRDWIEFPKNGLTE